MRWNAKLTVFVLGAMVATSSAALAQADPAAAAAASVAAPAKLLSFDTVSIKRNLTMDSFPGPMFPPHGDGFFARNITLIWVMYYAFDLEFDRNEDHFSGLPGWVKSERYDILAKVSDADVAAFRKLDETGRRRMIRDLLADRFGLKVHTESHEQPIYALVVAKGGVKMKEVELVDLPAYGRTGYTAMGRQGTFGRQVSMQQIALYLSTQQVGRPVVDQTGLTGHYDFTLAFSPMQAGADESATASDPSRPFLFTAVQEQLGLKLVPSKGPVETIAIDHVERPSEN